MMGRPLIGAAAVALALTAAVPTRAEISITCKLCVTVCSPNKAGGQSCEEQCYEVACPVKSSVGVVALPGEAAALRKRNGSSCSMGSPAGARVRGKLQGGVCRLERPFRVPEAAPHRTAR
jgi:hypothetical protein